MWHRNLNTKFIIEFKPSKRRTSWIGPAPVIISFSTAVSAPWRVWFFNKLLVPDKLFSTRGINWSRSCCSSRSTSASSWLSNCNEKSVEEVNKLFVGGSWPAYFYKNLMIVLNNWYKYIYYIIKHRISNIIRQAVSITFGEYYFWTRTQLEF